MDASVSERPFRTPQTGWRYGIRSLENRQFKWIFGSNLAFFFAMNGQFVVRSILAFRLTDSAFALGLVNLAVSLPMLIISPFGGVVADRVERKRLIMVGQALLLTNEVVICALLLSGALQFWHLLCAVSVMGCIFPFIMPARQAIVANVVGREGLSNAMALQMGAMNMARVAGPVTAGFVVAVVGLNWMYLVAVALYLIGLLSISRIDRCPPEREKDAAGVLSDLAEGLKYVRGDAPVRVMLLFSLVPILLAMPFQALLVVFTDDVWKVGDGGLGVLQACAGLGGIIGSVLVAWRGETPRKLRMLMASVLGFGGTLFLFALSPWFFVALPLVLISDIFASTFNTVNNTIIQVLIPDAVRGRVNSLLMMTFGLTPLGTLPVSAAAQAWGAPAAVAGASLITIVVSVLFYFGSAPLRTIDEVHKRAMLEGTRNEPVVVGGAPVGVAEPAAAGGV